MQKLKNKVYLMTAITVKISQTKKNFNSGSIIQDAAVFWNPFFVHSLLYMN